MGTLIMSAPGRGGGGGARGFRGGNKVSLTSGRGGGSFGSTAGAGGGRAGDGDSGKPERRAILDLAKYVDKKIRVQFAGGRQVTGLLKGYDQLLNLVMDDIEEEFETGEKRTIGLAVLRGTQLVLISPVDGSAEIENP